MLKRYVSILGGWILTGLSLSVYAQDGQGKSAVKENSAYQYDTKAVRPIAELLPLALQATPPVEKGSFQPSDLVDIHKLDKSIHLDIRYATKHNFLGVPVYKEARAFLQKPAAEALVRVQKKLIEKGYQLVVLDAYRPWYVTKIFWDATPADKHDFVADPQAGSRHNRGMAVDVTLYDVSTHQLAAMPSLYDEMTHRAYPDYTGGTPEERARRDLLRQMMISEGFSVYPYEWWHFDYKNWEQYPIQNITFEAIDKKIRK